MVVETGSVLSGALALSSSAPLLHPAASGAHAPHEPADVVKTFHEIIDTLPEQIALVDEHWTILTVNAAWTKTVWLYRYPELAIGANYRKFCRQRMREGHTGAIQAEAAIAHMEKSGANSARFIYTGTGAGAEHDFELRISRLELGGRTYATIARYDISELTQLRREHAEFSEAVIHERLAERRRIARELHDSTSQLLVCIGLGLGQLRRSTPKKGQRKVVSEMEGLLRETQRSIRSMSYLAYPPDVEKLGLVEAIRTITCGFAARAGLEIKFEADEGFTLPSPHAEMAIYRIVQEALSNIHRHAHATEAEVRLVKRKGATHVVVADNGAGVAPGQPKGVGLNGMAGRLAELDGRLSIVRTPKGTAVIASLPGAES